MAEVIDASNMRPSEIAQYVMGLEKALTEITRLEQENAHLKKRVNGMRLHMGWEPIDFDHWGEL